MDKSFETPPEHFVPLLTSGESKHLLGIANVLVPCPRCNPGADWAQKLFLHQKVTLIKSDNTICIKFYNVFCKFFLVYSSMT